MNIGIIGAGGIGQAIATQLARANIPAILSNRRGPDSLRDIVQQFGPVITAGTVQQAAQADIVFVAVNWSKIPAALKELPHWNGRIVVDTNNPLEAPTFKPFDLGGRTSSEVVAELVPGARVVKAFNTLPPPVLAAPAQQQGGRRVIFYSGDDAAAKTQIAQLIEKLGFAGVDLGRLAEGGKLQQFPGGPLPALNLLRM